MASLALAYAERIVGEPSENQERSIRDYEQAIEVIQRQAMPELLAATIHNLATVYCRRIVGEKEDNLEYALKLLKQVLEVLDRAKTPYEWSNAKVNLANVYFDRLQGDRSENMERCIEHLEEATKVRTHEAMPHAWAETMTNLGNAYSARLKGEPMRNQEWALNIYRQVLKMTKCEAMPEQWATTKLNMAKLYVERIEGDKTKNLERSIEAYSEALSVYTKEARPFRWALATSNMAEAFIFLFERTKQEEDIESAIKLCDQALTIYKRESMPFAWARTQSILAHAYAERRTGPRTKNLRRALDACREALMVRTPDISPSRHRISANLLGKLCAEAGRWNEAAKAFSSAIDATEKLCRASLFRGSEQVERGLAGFLYRRAAEALARVGRAQAAVVIAELGRARVLGDALSRNQLDLATIRSADPQACDLYQKAVEGLRSLESLKRSEGSFSAGHWASSDSENLRQSTQAARADLDKAIARIRKIPGCQEVLLEPDFDDIAAVVQVGQPLVYLLPLESQTLALLVSRQADSGTTLVETHWLASLSRRKDNRDEKLTLPPPGKGPELIGQIMELLQTTVGEGILRPLSDRLHSLSATSVTLIPGSMLGSIYPLHAIPFTRAGQTSCLLDEFNVTYAPSARVLAQGCRALEVRGHRRPTLVGVGNPDTKGFDSLPYAKAEVEIISDHFDQSHLLCGHEATVEAFVVKLPEADYIHLACHGQYDPDTPMAAQLLFTDQQTLHLKKLLDLHPFKHNRLVVLSACTSGTSQPLEVADEMIGLPTGFLEAGAPAVIGTLWTVNDLSTALLMTKFYSYHLQGDPAFAISPLPPPAALRRAQLWLRDVTAGELLTLLDRQQAQQNRRGQTGKRWLSDQLTAECVADFLSLDPASCPFANPYYWAPFLFLGV